MRSEAVQGVAPQNDYTVARVNQELANRSAVGAILVSRDGESSDDYNRSYALDGRWGFITREGEWHISPQFEHAHHFSEGLAAVAVADRLGLVGPIFPVSCLMSVASPRRPSGRIGSTATEPPK